MHKLAPRSDLIEKQVEPRSDIIVPFGFLSMLIQAGLFAWLYARAFANRAGTVLSRGLVYAAFGAVLSWSFTTLAVAAKNQDTREHDIADSDDYFQYHGGMVATVRALTGTLAFVDISGFTRLTEILAGRGKAGAEELTGFLDAIFAELDKVAKPGAILASNTSTLDVDEMRDLDRVF